MDKFIENKQLYVVLGMARSGTSAITRGLQALGIPLGETLHQANQYNARGYWEDDDIVYKINRNLLFFFNYPWVVSAVREAMMQHAELTQAFMDYAKKIINQKFSNNNVWGFKDPRTITLLPFWLSVIQALNVEDRYVICLRNPLASAYSNKKFSHNDKDIESGLIAWITHMVTAVDETIGKKRVLVSYENLIANPDNELMRIKDILKITIKPNEADIHFYKNNFIDKSLQHHVFTLSDLKKHTATKVVPLCLSVYELLMEVANDQFTLDSDVFELKWRKIKDKYNESFYFYCYTMFLLKKNKNTERKLRTIHQSLPWRLIVPIRKMDDFLRKRRKEKRFQKKLAILNQSLKV